MDNCSFLLEIDGYTQEFGSQEELDSFLRDNRSQLIKALSEQNIKFSKSRDIQTEVADQLRQLSDNVTFVEDGHQLIVNNEEYKSVTKTIADPQPNGKRWVPSFELENWENEMWGSLSTEVAGDGTPKYTDLEKKEIINDIKKKWEVMSAVGTSWHKIAEKFFAGELSTPNDIAALFPDLAGMDYLLQKYIQSLQVLKAELIKKHGDDAVFLSEVKLYDKERKIAGITDLLIVDKAGKVHIYDYKTSYKHETSWTRIKTNTVDHQMAMYRQILKRREFKVDSVNIIPVHLKEIDYKSGIVREFTVNPIMRKFLGNLETSSQNVEELLPYDPSIDLKECTSNKDVHHLMKEGFNYEQAKEAKNSLNVDNEFNRLRKTAKGDEYEMKVVNKWKRFPVKSSEKEIKEWIAKNIEEIAVYQNNLPLKVYEFVKYAKDVIAKDGEIDVENHWGSRSTDTKQILERLLYKYIYDTNWVPLESDALFDLGLAAFENKSTGEVDFMSLTADKLTTPKSGLLLGKSLLGNFLKDRDSAKLDVPTVVKNGDIELMKIYAFIKANKATFESKKIGSLFAVNIVNYAQMYDIPTVKTQSIDYLDKQWDLLMQHIPASLELKNKNWKFQRRDAVESMMVYVAEMFNNKQFKVKTGKKEKIKLTYDRFLAVQDKASKIALLGELHNTVLEALGYNLKTAVTGNQEASMLLKFISDALIQMGDLPTRIEEDLKNLGNVLEENRYTTNPNNFTIVAMSKIVELTRIALNNVGHRFKDYSDKSRMLHYGLYSNSDLAGVAKTKVLGYNLDVFDNLLEVGPDKKRTMRFKDINDRTLTVYEREYIKRYLELVNGIRRRKYAERYGEDSEQWNEFISSAEARNIPLMKASALSAFRGKDYKTFLKDYTRDIVNPNNIYDNDKESTEKLKHQVEMFNSFDTFDINVEARQEKVSTTPTSEFEQDLEAVLDLYFMADAKEQEFNKQLPLINALRTNIMFNEHYLFNNVPTTEETISDYIETVIFGKSIVKGESEGLAVGIKTTQDAMSIAAMGLSPFSGLTELFTGMFGNITRTLANVYDKNAFGLKELTLAGNVVLGDLGTNKTSLENINLMDSLNEMFRMSEMDVKQMAHKVQSTSKGMLNFKSHWMYWFNTFPGYMNRMTLFTAQLIKDGVLKVNAAGQVTKDSPMQLINGKLVYNELLDDRFKEYLRNKDLPEGRQSESWKEARARYLKIQEELKQEPNGLKADGSLARPYTNKQKDSMKELADEVHGHYDMENKIWLQKVAIGKILMQFKGWASSKKNRWYLKTNPNSPKGYYEMQYVDGQPVYVWNGTVTEGIFQSFMHLCGELKDQRFNINKSWDSLRPEQKQNFVWMISDLLALGILSLFISLLNMDTLKKENPLNYQLAKSLNNSSRDLFIGNTIAAFAGEKNPIAIFGWSSSVADDTWGVLTGRDHAAKDLSDNIGVVRTLGNLVKSAQ